MKIESEGYNKTSGVSTTGKRYYISKLPPDAKVLNERSLLTQQ